MNRARFSSLSSAVFLTVLLGVFLAGCAAPVATISQHDFGGDIPAGGAQSPVPLRSIQVVARPVVSVVAMQYREASRPTRRSSYTYNRWAAPPAVMVESALIRLMTLDGTGACRLQVSLSEFLIEVAFDGASQARISADVSVVRDPPNALMQKSFDVLVPMSEPGPANGALAFGDAVQKLAQNTSDWLRTEPAKACRP
jgi:ABC-type uncharacterized transport system auxiliary subunit